MQITDMTRRDIEMRFESEKVNKKCRLQTYCTRKSERANEKERGKKKSQKESMQITDMTRRDTEARLKVRK